MRCQIGTSSAHGGRRYLPFAFTEQGVAMLSGILNSPRAVQVNIEIMRAFIRLRQWLTAHAELARKMAEMERHYDEKFRVVFDVLRQLVAVPASPPRPIGFQVRESRRMYRVHRIRA